MFRYTVLLLVLIFVSPIIQAQKFYFKPRIHYHLPLTTQEAPEYFDTYIIYPGSWDRPSFEIPHNIDKFSLAKGTSFSGIFGYDFKKDLGLEAGIHYFNRSLNYKTDKIYGDFQVETGWEILSVYSSVSLVFHHQINRICVSPKAGLILGVTKLKRSVYFNEGAKSFEMKPHISTGYLFAIECTYSITDRLGVSVEAGIDNIFYTPSKAEVMKDDFEYLSEEYRPEYLKKIKYVKEIREENIHYDNFRGLYYTESNEPLLRLKETIKLNSFYTGFGLTFNIGENAEN